MAAHTSLLLVIVLCAAAAHCLICYTCDRQPTNAKCLTATECDSDETYCQTTVTFVSIVGFSTIEISKMCAPNCTPSVNMKMTSSNTTCCDTDLCNESGGATIRSSRAAILLALGSVLIILKSSVL